LPVAEVLASIGTTLKQLTVPVLLGILVSATILLSIDDHATSFLGLQEFRSQHRSEISLALIGSLSLLIGRAAVALWPLAWAKIAAGPQTVVIIPEARPNALWWSHGTRGDKPVRQVVGDFIVTNTTGEAIQLIYAVLRLRRWLFFGRSQKGDAGGRIPPRTVASIRVHFIGLVKKKPAGRLVADVAMVDQFGNHHWLRRLVFRDTSQPMDDP
jgi:hypothetical protein